VGGIFDLDTFAGSDPFSLLRRLPGPDDRGVRLTQRGVPSGIDCGDLARRHTDVAQGLSAPAAGALTSDELRRVAALSIWAWPNWYTRRLRASV
jgi:hypothetical protein